MEIKPPPKNHPIDHRALESIKDAISMLPELDPPAEFADRIISQIQPHKVSILYRVKAFLFRQVTLSFVPLKWVPVAACALLLFALIYPTADRKPGQAPKNEQAEFSYIMGRSALATDNPQNALPYLKAAVDQEPTKADYHFWLGVAYWAVGNRALETESYARALHLNPDFLPAHVYLGHNYLENQRWQDAIVHYEKVLAQVPDHAELLFNTGIAYRKLSRTTEENAIWTRFLSHTNTGPRAVKAVKHLNSNGEFSMQLAYFGGQPRVLKSIAFKANGIEPLPESIPPLIQAGQIIRDTPNLLLHIIVYEKDHMALARKRSKRLKKYITDVYPEIDANHIRTSWFDVPRRLKANGEQYSLDSSVQLFAERVVDS
jgi:tetratricopeptide (TPR) repeat protein